MSSSSKPTYYFDGIDWIQDTELISGNKYPNNYNVYTDNVSGINNYLQHKLEVPITLISYEKSYVNTMNVMLMNALPTAPSAPRQNPSQNPSQNAYQNAYQNGMNAYQNGMNAHQNAYQNAYYDY